MLLVLFIIDPFSKISKIFSIVFQLNITDNVFIDEIHYIIMKLS